ncbi:glycosyltransferase [Paraglaciecola sp. 25GB23A]|uniref:glycosyltransferase n=1 Tax=Paraglaciecola sp. 25GB23A TaxID=3156068 RepID=UPI0032AEFF1B
MKKQAKISVMHITYDMRIGGTEMVIKSIIEGSDHSLLEMSIFCIESPLGPFAAELLDAGIKIVKHARKPGFDLSLIKAIRQHIKQHKIDIVHCHQYTPYIYGVFAAMLTSTKVIFTEHGRFYPDSGTWKRKLINPILHRLTAATTSISAATKDALVIFENLPREGIEVVYNGTAALHYDDNKISQLKKYYNITEQQLCLGTIARLDPIKNHRMMLESFKIVLESGIDAKLLIVGDGEERVNIENTIITLGLKNNVILTGYEPKPQNLLAMMDIYLLSSLSEGTSITLLEAMSIGKPCIVTHAGGNPEIIDNNVVGLVTPNDDALAFAEAIISLSSDRNLMAQFGVEAKKRFNNCFSLQKMNQAYQKLYIASNNNLDN